MVERVLLGLSFLRIDVNFSESGHVRIVKKHVIRLEKKTLAHLSRTLQIASPRGDEKYPKFAAAAAFPHHRRIVYATLYF